MITKEQLTEMLVEAFKEQDDDFDLLLSDNDYVFSTYNPTEWDIKQIAAKLCEKLNAHNPPPEPSDNYPDELVERIKCASVQSGEAYTFEQFKKWANEPSSPSTVKRKDLR